MRAFRTIIFWTHLVLGCVAGLVILIMSATGILLAFERQINNWADTPAVLESTSGALSPAKLDTILASLSASGQGTPSEFVVQNSAHAPLTVRYGRERTLFLNPWTGEIIGQPSESTRAFFSKVEQIHRSLGLGMRNAFGRGATGAANLIFLFVLVSGLYLWLPAIFNAISVKKRLWFGRGLHARARNWNWHHVIGIWTAIPLFFIVLTGVVMSYPWASNLLFTVTGSQPPAFGGRPGFGSERGGDRPAHAPVNAVLLQFRSVDDIVQSAKQQVPAWKSITVEVPAAQDRSVTLSVDKSIGGQPEQATQFVFNRRSGKVEKVNRFSDNTLGRKLRAWARFTHTGEEFGLIGQTIGALACLGGVLLVWTGLAMAIRRAVSYIKRPSGSSRERAAPEVSV
jgi:uncharacterized iron-regulated membrane protein